MRERVENRARMITGWSIRKGKRQLSVNKTSNRNNLLVLLVVAMVAWMVALMAVTMAPKKHKTMNKQLTEI